MTLSDNDTVRLIDLMAYLDDARQGYDAVVALENPKLDRVLSAGDQLSNAAYELYTFLALRLTPAVED